MNEKHAINDKNIRNGLRCLACFTCDQHLPLDYKNPELDQTINYFKKVHENHMISIVALSEIE
ncbi:hypothetical protein LCGC14_2294780 [marine sediment metagenome]|uniref:Uncharacterized protein n=1 Tax=marine sediment metagenome TaxID=412755 RepID=A0A0F9CQ60_9ZZZZ